MRGVQLGLLGAGADASLTGLTVAGLGAGAGEDVKGVVLAFGGVGAGDNLTGIAVGGLGAGAGENITGHLPRRSRRRGRRRPQRASLIGGLGAGASARTSTGLAVGGLGGRMRREPHRDRRGRARRRLPASASTGIAIGGARRGRSRDPGPGRSAASGVGGEDASGACSWPGAWSMSGKAAGFRAWPRARSTIAGARSAASRIGHRQLRLEDREGHPARRRQHRPRQSQGPAGPAGLQRGLLSSGAQPAAGVPGATGLLSHSRLTTLIRTSPLATNTARSAPA
ncbi:MAG: hypothetical protein MZU79_07405 [Anaerotruncus sp.]|nr:hypothetical protein [Anaerotruncus sp.]